MRTDEVHMIDLHAHILYGLDDGAENSEMMLSMFHIAAEEGITQIVAHTISTEPTNMMRKCWTSVSAKLSKC